MNEITHDHLHMKELFQKWVPRLVTPFQKRQHCSKALSAMCQEKQDLFLPNLFCRMKQHYDPETKGQSKLSTLTYHPQKGTRHILCRQGHAHSLLGATWSSDDGFLDKRHYNDKSLLRFTAGGPSVP